MKNKGWMHKHFLIVPSHIGCWLILTAYQHVLGYVMSSYSYRVHCMYKGESKSNAFFSITGIITDTGTCIIHQNEAEPLWITSLLLNIVTISLNSSFPPSNESMYSCHVKFCWLFFEPLHCSFHFLITDIIFTSLTFFHGAEEMINITI